MNDADASPGHAALAGSPPPKSAQDPLPKLSADQRAKLADMIAAETTAFPEKLDPDDREQLTVMVRDRLRRRLVVLIARAMAQEFARESTGEKETTSS